MLGAKVTPLACFREAITHALDGPIAEMWRGTYDGPPVKVLLLAQSRLMREVALMEEEIKNDEIRTADASDDGMVGRQDGGGGGG